MLYCPRFATWGIISSGSVRHARNWGALRPVCCVALVARWRASRNTRAIALTAMIAVGLTGPGTLIFMMTARPIGPHPVAVGACGCAAPVRCSAAAKGDIDPTRKERESMPCWLLSLRR